MIICAGIESEITTFLPMSCQIKLPKNALGKFSIWSENRKKYSWKSRFFALILRKVTFGRVKGGLRLCDRRPLSMPKATFRRAKERLRKTKMVINRTILGRFRSIKSSPKIYKSWFVLIISNLVKCLIIRVFWAKGKVFFKTGRNFEAFVKIFPNNFYCRYGRKSTIFSSDVVAVLLF